MNILKKINNLNEFISFHIFSASGWIALFSSIYLTMYYNHNLRINNDPSWSAAFGWIIVIHFFLFISILIISFIIFLIEQLVPYKIKNNTIKNNKLLKLICYMGAILASIYIDYILFQFVDVIIIERLSLS